jgi:hypothetical protein
MFPWLLSKLDSSMDQKLEPILSKVDQMLETMKLNISKLIRDDVVLFDRNFNLIMRTQDALLNVNGATAVCIHHNDASFLLTARHALLGNDFNFTFY